MVLLPLSNKEEKALLYSERYFDLLVLESCSIAKNWDKTVPTISIFFCQEIQMCSTNINEATFTIPERQEYHYRENFYRNNFNWVPNHKNIRIALQLTQISHMSQFIHQEYTLCIA